MIALLLLPFVFVGFLVVGWVGARRRRQRRLSGTLAARPVFTVDPPRRHLHRTSGERL